jgi:DNA (cytosine-5)-methyltransferase 1
MEERFHFRMGELFSGPGGMALGAHFAASKLENLDLIHQWANDIDADTCSTYVRNIPGASNNSVICADVRNLDVSQLAPIDGFAFGFPCNDFSVVGKSQGLNGSFGPLYTHGVRVLNSHNPLWFVAENVSGLQSANDGNAFELILSALEKAGINGYRLYPHKYQFDLYGVPQKRTRIIIVGIRGDLDVEFKIPSPEIYSHHDVSVANALGNPPIKPDVSHHEAAKQSQRVVERLQHIKPGENAFNSDLPEHLKLNVRGATISQIYRRLRADHPSYTVTGSGGGGTHVYHWIEDRALTNRERARLQTFPDSFEFSGKRESVRKQIGMAVPVSGAEAIFTALFNSFLGRDYPSVASNVKRPAATARKSKAEN